MPGGGSQGAVRAERYLSVRRVDLLRRLGGWPSMPHGRLLAALHRPLRWRSCEIGPDTAKAHRIIPQGDDCVIGIVGERREEQRRSKKNRAAAARSAG